MADEDRERAGDPHAEEPGGGAVEADRAEMEALRRIQRERQTRLIKAIIALAIIVVLIVFVVRNSEDVPVDFVFFSVQARLIWVLVVTALLGGLAGYLLARPRSRPRGKAKGPQPGA